MSLNNNTAVVLCNHQAGNHEDIHKIISCEKISLIAEKHRELCHGIHASINGGAKPSDLEPLLMLMLDQSDEITSLLSLKISLDIRSRSLKDIVTN